MIRLGVLMIGFAISAMLLSGCNPEVGDEVNCSGPPLNCHGRGEVRIPFSSSGFSASQYFYPSTIALDFTGSNVGIPTTGFITFKALGVNGAPVAMTTGSFTQSNGIGYLDNPNAVHAWLQGVSSTISSLEAEFTVPVNEVVGQNTFNIQVSHDNEVLVAAGETWFRSGLCNSGPLMSEHDCLET